MNEATDPSPEPGEPGAAPPDQEELQRRLEEQLREVRVQDLLLESVASILNLSARRIGKEDERDLEQARVGIEAVRAVRRPARRGPARAGARGALAGADALRARGAGRRGRRRRRSGWPPPGPPRPEPPPAWNARRRLWTPLARRNPDSDRYSTRASRPEHPRPLLTEKTPYGGPLLTDFLTDYGVVIALVCAGAAVLYGALVTQRLLAPLARQRAHAGDLGRRPGGRQGLPEPPVPDHRHGRDSARDPDRDPPGRHHRDRLRDRRRALRRRRVHRHEPLGARQRPGRRGGPRRRAAGARRRLQGRLGHRPAGRRPGAARRRRLLRHPGRSPTRPTRRPSTR